MFIRSVRGVWMTSENQARISHYRIRIKQEKKKKRSLIIAKQGGEGRSNSEGRQGMFEKVKIKDQ